MSIPRSHIYAGACTLYLPPNDLVLQLLKSGQFFTAAPVEAGGER